jgi:hypothetical protein
MRAVLEELRGRRLVTIEASPSPAGVAGRPSHVVVADPAGPVVVPVPGGLVVVPVPGGLVVVPVPAGPVVVAAALRARAYRVGLVGPDGTVVRFSGAGEWALNTILDHPRFAPRQAGPTS